MYPWLDCREPWITEDDVSVTQTGQEEAHFSFSRSGLYFQVGIEADGAKNIGRTVDIDDFPWFDQSFEGNASFPRISLIDEIFCSSCVEECGGFGPLAQSVNENFY